MGVDFGQLRGATGAKIKKKYVKKVNLALLHNKINCIKVVLKSHIYIIQL